MVNLTPYIIVFAGIFCLMGIAVTGALLGWGLEILRRRHVTLIILLGLFLSAFLIGFLLLWPQVGPPIVNAVRPVPTMQATAEPLPTPTATPTPAPTRRVRGG
jgi:cytochrome bd-type quinol oxidase subunit 2